MIRSHTRIIVQQRRPRFSRLSYCPLLARTLALDLRITHARTLTLSAWHASWVWCAEPPWLPALIPTSARRIPTETRNARGTKTNASENRIARNCPSRLLARRGLAPSGMLAPRPAPTRAYSLMLAVDTRSRTLTVTSAPGSVCGCLLVALSPPLCASLVSRPTTTSTLLVDAVSPVLPGTAPRPYLYCPTCLGPTYVNPRLCPTQRYVLRTIMH